MSEAPTSAVGRTGAAPKLKQCSKCLTGCGQGIVELLNLVVALSLRQTPQTVNVVLAAVLALAVVVALEILKPLQAMERNVAVAVAVAVVLPLQKTRQHQS